MVPLYYAFSIAIYLMLLRNLKNKHRKIFPSYEGNFANAKEKFCEPPVDSAKIYRELAIFSLRKNFSKMMTMLTHFMTPGQGQEIEVLKK